MCPLGHLAPCDSAHFPQMNSGSAVRIDGASEIVAAPGQELYLGEVEDMADAILLGVPPRVSLADSRVNVATILALLRPAREGKPVTL